MSEKCFDIDALTKVIVNKCNPLVDKAQMGKTILRTGDGLICTVFNNGTVQFQGKSGTDAQAFIEQAILNINSNYQT